MSVIHLIRSLVSAILVLLLVACGGGGGGSSAPAADTSPAPVAAPPTDSTPAPEPESKPTTLVFKEAEAARFLSQATFGPTRNTIDAVVADGPEAWLLEQLEKPATLHLEAVLSQFPADGRFFDENGDTLQELKPLPAVSFWTAAIKGEDQLRQRMAFALSQILVVSANSSVGDAPQILAHYMDTLTKGAFGNYRDLLERVTYSPAMAIYLTYLRNRPADAETGRVTDENYAREILQLFTLGLVELKPNGQPVKAEDGSEVELYDNSDITELAKVFTGLSFSGTNFDTRLNRVPLASFHASLEMFDEYSASGSKQFLGNTIAADTGGAASIELALDIIFEHPNLGPFLGRQLIQRFVTSHPTNAHVRRVSEAFDAGSYQLPGGEVIGTGQRGDLAAVISAVLFDIDAGDASVTDNPASGKLREPVIRFTHWARAFEVNSADSSNERALRNTSSPQLLGQQPYGSPSVFNFYRPGYIAAGTSTGDAGLTAPELQITNAGTIIGYANFLTLFALQNSPRYDNSLPRAFVPDYAPYTSLADDTTALLDSLDLILTHGTLAPETRQRITDVLASIDQQSTDTSELKTQAAVILIMTSPEYIVLR